MDPMPDPVIRYRLVLPVTRAPFSVLPKGEFFQWGHKQYVAPVNVGVVQVVPTLSRTICAVADAPAARAYWGSIQPVEVFDEDNCMGNIDPATKTMCPFVVLTSVSGGCAVAWGCVHRRSRVVGLT